MVCMSSYPPHAATLLRRGSRMAGRLNTDWFVVYVETPRRGADRIDAEAQRHLLANIERARELGAEVVRLQGARPGAGAARLRALARRRAHHRSAARTSRGGGSCSARSVPLRLVREASGFDLHIVSLERRRSAP